MQNHLDCEGSLLVEGGDNCQRATACILTSPKCHSRKVTHVMRGCIMQCIPAESLQLTARLADWARASRIQSGLLWPEVGTAFVCVTNLEEKTFSDNLTKLCPFQHFPAQHLCSPQDLYDFLTFTPFKVS